MSASKTAENSDRRSYSLSAYVMPLMAIMLGAGVICLDASHSMSSTAPDLAQLQRQGLGP